MTKVNIQTTTRAMKDESRELLKKIKNLQEDVHKSLQGMRTIENDLKEQKRQEQLRQKAEEAASAERLTAYVMPDDPEPIAPKAQDTGVVHAVAETKADAAGTEAIAASASHAPVPEATSFAQDNPTQQTFAPTEAPHAPQRPVAQAPRPQGSAPRPQGSAPRPAQSAPDQTSGQAASGQPEIIYPFTSASGAKPQGTYVRGSAPPARQYDRGPRPAQGGAPRPQGAPGGRPPQAGVGRPMQGGAGRPMQGGAGRPMQGGAGRPMGAGGAAGAPGRRPAGAPGAAAASANKEKVSNYDPNRSNYTRSYDNDRRSKNKKTATKEAPPSMVQDDERMGSRKRKGAKRNIRMAYKPEPIVIDHAVLTNEMTTVKDLSEKIGKPAAEIIKKLFLLGIMATINQELDFDTCELIAAEYKISLEHNVAKTAEETMLEAADEIDADDLLQARPPVVTIMGHVDHGKTSLLDAIRETNVTSGEAGGITQHIGAYTVSLNDRVITFLDTPGHEAFTSMRARGAQATDIAILVVAADDGIMPQTVEAINHAKAAEVPIIVAINKMDKPDANPDKVMQQLTEHGLVVEEWGGDVIAVPVSAKTRMNLDRLLDMILLVADVQEFRANPDRPAKGIIIEAELDKGRGPVATVLVKNGTLRVGDNVIAGTAYGRVRAMINDKGQRVEEALPSYPVEVLGFNEVPDAGDILNAVESDQLRAIADERKDKIKAEKVQALARVSLDNLFSQIAEGQVKDLNVIVKADVQGSVEAVKQSLEKLSNSEVRVRCIHGGVGAITETDVMFATASNAIVIGFNVRPEPQARDAAEREGIDLRLYRVIYNAIEDIEKAMKGMLAPEFREHIFGRAEVRTVFKVTGVGTIGGSYVQDGKIVRNAELRVLRDNVVIHEGKISSLKRFKDDVKEVASGYECGIGVENYNDIKEGDVFECFEMEQIER